VSEIRVRAAERISELSRALDKAPRERDPTTGHLLPSVGKQDVLAEALEFYARQEADRELRQ
jgi:hypothetical protein